MIRTLADVPEGFTARTDVVVIGSGAGGGVAAAVFAESGREVILLEEGQHVPGARMSQREDEMYPLLYRDGGAQLTDDGGVNVLQGRALGGSTVINMADVVPIPMPVLAHWRAHFDVDRYSDAAVQEAAAAVSAAIGASPIDAGEVNRNNALILDGAKHLGLKHGVFQNNRVGCIGSGYCLIGCAYDAKRSVALTWIPRGMATGRLLCQTQARVDRIETHGSRATAVVGSVIRSPDNHAVAPFRVEADHVVLAAGAIHTPLILLRSGLGGPAVGRNLSLQPQAPVAAIFPDKVRLFRGIPQAAYAHVGEDTEQSGLGGYYVEGVSAGPALAAVSANLGTREVHAFMSEFDRVASCLCLVPDRPTGTVTDKGNGRPKINYPLSDRLIQTLRAATRTAAEVYLSQGAEMVVPPFVDAGLIRTRADLAQLDTVPVRPAGLTLISAHPQGTARMGIDDRRSVVGNDLFVHGVRNLQVLDASVFPTTASSHTMIPVMTWAYLGAMDAVG
jgi:choline dehydrogenase-like flavoprotein